MDEERGKGRGGEDLGDIVLSWSLDQIRDECLFRNQVERIPSTFSSIRHYFQSFTLPLMEETRSELSSSFDDISKAPCARILSKEEGCRKSNLEGALEYYIDVEFIDGGSQNYKARNGDFFMLSSIELKAVEDLYRYNVAYCLVLVTKVSMDEGTQKGFVVKISKVIDADVDFSNYNFAFFLTNILTNIRIWKAIHFPPEMNNNFSIITELLFPSPMVASSYNACLSEGNSNWLAKLSDKLLLIDLNDSQMDAVRAAIHATKCRDSHIVELVWGPPGTGKTKTVSAMLWAFLQMKFRTLTCAPTNVAVTGVCSRLVKLVKYLNEQDKLFGLPSSLGNVVIFGSRDRMEITDELQDVFLDDRVELLVDYFAPLTGWKSRIAAMISFLEDCSSRYELFIENSKEEEILTFSEFLMKQFNAVLEPLDNCLRNLWIHTNCISSNNASKISALLHLLGMMHSLLSDGRFSDDELKEAFLKDKLLIEMCHDFVTSKHESSKRKKLSKARIETLHLLRILQGTLSFPHLTDKIMVRNFCLQSALLIFCTTSSSCMLHHVEMDPLHTLVIDEAAQLRECESVIPLRLNWLKHAILVGDERQLPSTVKSQVSKDAGFGVSLFERLSSIGLRKHLNMQYRMHPSISLFPNSKFYNKQILDGPIVEDVNYNKHYEDLKFGSYAFLHLADGREENDNGNSKRNFVEVAVVLHLVEEVFKNWRASSEIVSIGVISPYSSQVNAIKEKLGNKYDTHDGFDIRVKSIDGFQGEENDIIILSTVRSNSKGNIGFLRDHQRTNVALTRARHCLWIVGNANTLARSGSIWGDLVLNAKRRECYFNATDDVRLAKVVLHVKHELNQLEDLLNSDSVLLSNARWKVLFSDDFIKSFVRVKHIQAKKEVIQVLLKIAEGWRTKWKIQGFSDSYGLVRIYKVREIYIIWTVDIMKDDRYIQVIKVWDLLSLEQIARLVSRLDHIFSTYTEVYLEHCKAACLEGKLEVPLSWNVVHDIVRYKALSKVESAVEEDVQHLEFPNGMENSKVSESLLLMKFYSLSSGIVQHLLTASDGAEIAIPFELTDQEKKIICFPLSTFILGRSGTGKTTILTTKLIEKEQQYSIASEGTFDKSGLTVAADNCVVLKNDSSPNKGNFLKQVFITVSCKLCSAIRSHVRQLRSFASGGEILHAVSSLDMHDNGELSDFLGIPDNFCGLKPEHYPLVITFRKLLLMLDGTMEKSFFDKFYSKWGVTPDQRGEPKSFALQALILSKEVNYEKFAGSYWPHFNEQLTKTVDASTIFTQIISHIKGELESGMVNAGKLEREDYVLLSGKRVSTLSRQTREIIYEIFIDYENKKLSSGEYDLSDFVNYLHHQLTWNGYAGDMIDFVYIDEVQDLTMRQIGLLKYVCKNFEGGYTFAGDTAQTIARGIDFRFEDIRSLYYTEFLSEVKRLNQERKRERQIRVTDMFQLTQNFRTHAGVLSLARSIMDLLYFFFPLSVDKLNPEFSLIYGEAPVLLESCNNENAILTIFGNSGSVDSSLNGFGAEQVILVRDNATKEQVFGLVGKQALVLTILECKGLEFQDVLLYNFFGASPLKNKWRVTYEYMKKQGIFEPSIARSFPSFEQERHNLLCSELKQLYVAITRTKQRLWICENTDDYSKPMFDYWKKLCLVQVRQLDSSLADAMKVASGAEDWRSRGVKLFNEANFELAVMCFEKAGDGYREKWAKASGLVASADRVISTNAEMGWILLEQAAELYESIGKLDNSANCYIKLNNFKKAGMIYMEKCGTSRLKDAGECFAMAECWTEAAHAYAKGEFFSECLLVCSTGRIFDTGLQIIEQWKVTSYSDEEHHHELNKLISTYLENCARHYLEVGDIRRMIMFVKAFELNDVQCFLDVVRHFLKSRNLLDEMLILEQEMGNFVEAASIARTKGNTLLEVEMLEKASCFEEATKLLLFHVIMCSLWSPGSNGWPLKRFAEKEDLLMKAKELAKRKSGSFQEYVFLEADILSDREKSLFDMSRQLDEAKKHQNLRQQIFITRAILDVHAQSKPSKFIFQHGSVFDSGKLAYDMMVLNHLSVDTMVYVWNLWSALIFNLLSNLHRPESTEDGLKYEEFCIEYFGIRKQEKDDMCFLQNPQASWVKNNAKDSLRKKENLVWMTCNQCISCAKYYWSNELFSVGMKVLESLESLHNFLVEKKLYPFCRGKVAIWMYEVTKFLTESEFTSARSTSKTRRYLDLSHKCYFDIVFPVDWRINDMVENVKFLHENKYAMEIIDALLAGNLKPRNGNLTHGQIGRVVMFLLLTGRLPDELFKVIMDCLNNMQPWRDFLEQYKTFLDFGFARFPVISNLQRALQSTYDADWRNAIDYLSPHCFIYLIECLLFFASSSQGFRGHFFTTKSTLLEMLKCHGCKGYMSACLTAAPDHFQLQNSGQFSLEFIIKTVSSLLSDKHQIFAWMRNSSMPREFYSSLALRLVSVLYLAHLNTGRCIYAVGRFLLDSNIFVDLPRVFFEQLRRAIFYGTGDGAHIIRVLSEALRMVENPLIIVCSPESRSMLSNLNALLINSQDMSCREKVVDLLFPEKKMIFMYKQSEKEPTGKGSFGIHSSFDNRNQEIHSIASRISDKKDQGSELVGSDIDQELPEQSKHFWQKFEEFLSGEHDDVELATNIFDTALSWIKQNDHVKDFDGHLITEMTDMHDGLKFLATLRSEGAEGCTKRVDLYAMWKGLKTRLEPLMNHDKTLFPHIQGLGDQASPSNQDDDNDKTLDSDPNMREAIVQPKPSSSDQTRESKGKKCKKSRKKSKGNGNNKTLASDPNIRKAVVLPEACSSGQTREIKGKESKKSSTKSKGKGKRR